MRNNIKDIKNDLKELCSEYINILEKLKTEKIITDEVFENCTSDKVVFLKE